MNGEAVVMAAVGDYSFHMAVTDFNDETKKEIKGLIEKEGISSFKTFMAYKGALMIDDRQMRRLMQEVKKNGGLINVHATNGDMIDYLIAKHGRKESSSLCTIICHSRKLPEAEASGRFTNLELHGLLRAILFTSLAKVL